MRRVFWLKIIMENHGYLGNLRSIKRWHADFHDVADLRRFKIIFFAFLFVLFWKRF